MFAQKIGRSRKRSYQSRGASAPTDFSITHEPPGTNASEPGDGLTGRFSDEPWASRTRTRQSPGAGLGTDLPISHEIAGIWRPRASKSHGLRRMNYATGSTSIK